MAARCPAPLPAAQRYAGQGLLARVGYGHVPLTVGEVEAETALEL